MARTVDTSSTFENWRQNYNDLATDVGDKDALITADKSSIVNAINDIMGQYFFFQDFDFDGSDGASSNTVFSGADNAGNVLQYKTSKVLVYKNGLLLRSGTDYTALNGTSVTLTSSANNSDVIRISSYTGSYTATPSGAETLFRWNIAGDDVWNNNSGGMVIQSGRAIGSIVTSPTVANSIQFDGPVYHNGTITVGVNDTGHDVKFFGATAGKSLLWDESADKLIITGTLNLTGDATFNSKLYLEDNLDMPDSAKVILGTGDDLQIYHDGSDSYIKDAGTGGLKVDTNTFDLRNAAGNETMISTAENGAVNLYYDNASKLHTQSDGIEVTGDTDTDTLTVSGNATVGGTLGVTGVATFTAVPVLPGDTIDSQHIVDDAIDSEHYAAGSIDSAHIANNAVTTTQLNVAAAGTSGQVLSSDGDGSFSWTNVSNTNTTYTQEWVDSGDNAILRLNPSTGSDDDLVMIAGTGISLTPSGDNLTITATAASPGDGVLTLAEGALVDLSGGDYTFSANQSGNQTVTFAVDLSELTDMTQSWVEAEDEFVVLDNGSQKRKLSSEIFGAGAFLDTAAVSNGATTLVTGDHVYDWVTAQGYTTETGDITGVTAGTGLSGGGNSGAVTLALDLTELTASTTNGDGHHFIVLSGGGTARKLVKGNIALSEFNNDSNWTSNTGTVTSVAVTTAAGLDGATTITSSGTIALSLDLSELPDMTQSWANGTDEFIVLDDGVEKRKLSSEIFGSNAFNSTTIPTNNNQLSNGAGYTTNTGTVLKTGTINANEYARWDDANTLEGRTTSEVRDDLGVPNLTGTINANEFARFTDANTLHALTAAEVRSALNVENGATADQSNAEIRTAVEAASDSNVFTDADHSKLNGIASSANNYSHPSHPGDDFSVDTGALSGAVVVSDIDINVTTDGSGHVTDANGSVATRTLTLANLGYTGVTNANRITLNSLDSGNFTFGTGIGISTRDIQVGGGTNLTAEANGLALDASITLTSVSCSGDITANTSDARLKDVIGIIENPLEKLSKINGYDFTWNETAKSLEDNTFDDEPQIGVMAQEIEEVLPSVVKPSAFEGYNTVQYEKIVPLLIESIKELQKEVESLKDSKT